MLKNIILAVRPPSIPPLLRAVNAALAAVVSVGVLVVAALQTESARAHSLSAPGCISVQKVREGGINISNHEWKNKCDKRLAVNFCENTPGSKVCEKGGGIFTIGPNPDSRFAPLVDLIYGRNRGVVAATCIQDPALKAKYKVLTIKATPGVIYPRWAKNKKKYGCKHFHCEDGNFYENNVCPEKNSGGQKTGDDGEKSGDDGAGADGENNGDSAAASGENGGANAGANSCKYADNGKCDEPRYCSPGTDANDCVTAKNDDGAGAGNASSAGANSCKYADNGECDEPRYCSPGTDANDCAAAKKQSDSNSGNQSSGNDSLASLRGTPPPAGAATEQYLREKGAWGGQLNPQIRVNQGELTHNFSHLHYAALKNDIEAASWLIANGAEVNARGSNDVTPLHYAGRRNAREVAALLLKNGAQVNAATKGSDNTPNGQTPMDWVHWEHGISETYSLLLSHGGRCNGTWC